MKPFPVLTPVQLESMQDAQVLADANAHAAQVAWFVLATVATCIAVLLLARLIRWLIDVPKSHLQRVARALEADTQTVKYLQRRRAA